jgi:hypothetical protein
MKINTKLEIEFHLRFDPDEWVTTHRDGQPISITYVHVIFRPDATDPSDMRYYVREVMGVQRVKSGAWGKKETHTTTPYAHAEAWFPPSVLEELRHEYMIFVDDISPTFTETRY